MNEPDRQDHYAILGVNADATTKEIRSRARKLYLHHHPDKGGNSQRFCQIRLAEEILTNDEKRSMFDRVYPYVRESWKAYHRAREQGRRKEEEIFRRKQEEAQRRTEEAIRRAQQMQERAAYERLRKIQEDEERRKAIEEERLKAREEEERLRSETLRLLALEEKAKARTEAVAEKRRIEAWHQAMQRLKQQIVVNALQEQREAWAQFSQGAKAEPERAHSSSTTGNPERDCCHKLWAKIKGKTWAQPRTVAVLVRTVVVIGGQIIDEEGYSTGKILDAKDVIEGLGT